MKTWVYICAIILAAGVMTGSAQNTANPPVTTNEVAAPPPAPAPAPAPAAPAPPKVTVPPRTATPPPPAPEIPVTSHKVAMTNTPPPAEVEEAKPAEEPLPPTNAAPAEGAAPTAPPANAVLPEESSGISHVSALLIGLAILLAGGVVALLIWRRSSAVPHGSLITSAMKELASHPGNEDKDEEKPAEPPAESRADKKKLEIKFPPPMT